MAELRNRLAGNYGSRSNSSGRDKRASTLVEFCGLSHVQQREINATAFADTTAASFRETPSIERDRLQQLDLLTHVQELKAANLGIPDEVEHKSAPGWVIISCDKQPSYKVYQALYQNDSDAPASADFTGTSWVYF